MKYILYGMNICSHCKTSGWAKAKVTNKNLTLTSQTGATLPTNKHKDKQKTNASLTP